MYRFLPSEGLQAPCPPPPPPPLLNPAFSKSHRDGLIEYVNP